MKTKIDFEKELNPQQLEVVKHIDGPQLVIAGAGSGKTRTLIYRLAYLVENGINPAAILLLTFTRKAAYEMMKRASALLDDRCSKVSGGTFHSFASMILRRYAQRIGYDSNFTIIDGGDGEDIINIIKNSMNLKTEKRFPNKSTLFKVISKSINTHRSIEDILKEDYPHFLELSPEIEEIYKAYKETKKNRNLMDYDDLLINLRDLLKIEDIRKRLSNNYRYIMVDEYQDTNRLQAQIASLLASEHGNIMVVGDDAQSIYSFRGADFKNIMDFPKIFPDTTIRKLEQNYRSTQPILDFTNAIIENAKEKYSKKLFSDIESDQKPYLIYVNDATEQANFICKKILELLDKGINLKDMAVLFRAAFHSNELEIELNRYHIPYVKYGGLKFVEAAHIKDMLAYLRVIYNYKDDVAWFRILLLLDKIGHKTAEKIISKVIKSENGIDSLQDLLKENSNTGLNKLYTLFSNIKKEEINLSEKLKLISEYYIPLLQNKYDNYNKRINDIITLIGLSEKYNSIEDFLTDMALEPPTDSQIDVDETEKEKDILTLSTIHSAKGLEWHTVFIINLTDGALPSSYSINVDNIEEERRLFYVATTRAKRNLFLISPNYCKIYNEASWRLECKSYSDKSRFLKEIEDLESLTERIFFTNCEDNLNYESNLDEDYQKKSYYNNIKNFFDD
ncbi:MAG TPA: ATP-dependent helicase [Spirochaetota bacterium]|nr:ATP-dependent helicase [Spirochaetota bacterium]HOL56918.1 ATP-dependent helicase [Spirochaetota bacterium]HPP04613.1 ATP-dependent helicase [Spirochaetota bacterium]